MRLHQEHDNMELNEALVLGGGGAENRQMVIYLMKLLFSKSVCKRISKF